MNLGSAYFFWRFGAGLFVSKTWVSWEVQGVTICGIIQQKMRTQIWISWREREAHLWNSASAKDAPGTLSHPCSSVSTLPALLHLHGTNLQDKFLFSRPFLCQLFLCAWVCVRRGVGLRQSHGAKVLILFFTLVCLLVKTINKGWKKEQL